LNTRIGAKVIVICGSLILLAFQSEGQSPSVPIYRQDVNSQADGDLVRAANLFAKSNTLTLATIREQLHRPSCQLDLPRPNTSKLRPREVWERARASYLRVGWFYLCTHCDQWRLNMAGGYLLTRDGAVGTGYHVVEPPRDLREGCLIVADDSGKIFPVSEILAANRDSDACILRIQGSGFAPLPLNTNVWPGDAAFCLSDPLGRRGYFSEGIVNRFFALPERRLPYTPGAPMFSPTRINVSTDWSFGSSGAPVLDEFGNAIGHVSLLAMEGTDLKEAAGEKTADPATIIFHEATSARDILWLVKAPK
jgi:hypothetical protein